LSYPDLTPMGLRSSPFLEGVREHGANYDTNQRKQGDEDGNDPGWH